MPRHAAKSLEEAGHSLHEIAHVFGVIRPVVARRTGIKVRDLVSMLVEITFAVVGNGVDLSSLLFFEAGMSQLFEKLKVRTRAQLVKIALEQYRDQL